MLSRLLRSLGAFAAFGAYLMWLRCRALTGTLARAEIIARGDGCMNRGEFRKALRLYEAGREAGAPPVRLYRNAVMDEGKKARGEAYVHRLRGVVLDADRCAIFDGDKVHVRETSARNLLNHASLFVRAPAAPTHYAVALPAPQAAIDRRVALIGTDGANYAHWIMFNVLKLALLEREGLLEGDLPLLLNDPLRPWQAEMLDFLGVPVARRLLVPPQGLIACRELVVPVIIANHPQARFGIDWLRRRYREAMRPASGAPRRVYVSRRSATRNLVNAAELEARLQELGFQAVELAGKSVAEQAACFAAAEVIVSPHEAGLANLVFASPGCRVIEITNTHMTRMAMFRNLADALGLRMDHVVSDRFAEGPAPLPYRDFHVDVDAVVQAVRAG